MSIDTNLNLMYCVDVCDKCVLSIKNVVYNNSSIKEYTFNTLCDFSFRILIEIISEY